MAILPRVQIAVHSFQEESHQQAPDGQADQKEDDRFCPEVFALKLRFLVVPVDVNVVSHHLATRIIYSCAASRTSTANTS